MIIDTHAHYNLEPFFPEWEPFWDGAKEQGVGISIIPGTDERSSRQAVEIAKSEHGLYAMVGVHPHEAIRTFKDPSLWQTWDDLIHRLIRHDKVVAVGECGLDFSHLSQETEEALKEKNAQKKLFGMQIQLAKGNNKPLSIHCRDAYTDLLDTLNHFSKEDGKYPKGVLHCISGNLEYLKQALDIGLYIGVCGNVTYKNAQNIRELVKATPIDRVVVETDMPYLPPQSMRGQVNRPEYINETVAFLADFLGIPLKEYEKQTEENARRLFSI